MHEQIQPQNGTSVTLGIAQAYQLSILSIDWSVCYVDTTYNLQWNSNPQSFSL